MERAQRIEGVVRDRLGTPVAGARVNIGIPMFLRDTQSRFERWFQGHHETTTDEAGRYDFDGVDVRSDVFGRRLIWATHPQSGGALFKELRAGETRIDFDLLGSGRIEGKVEGLRGGRPPVLAVRSDEPELSRIAMLQPNGEFVFDDVPCGDYTVSLKVPRSAGTSTDKVTVGVGETATAVLVMSNPGVRLTITVPGGCGLEVMLAAADHTTPEPEQTKARVIMKGASIWVNGRLARPLRSEETVSFNHLVPGKYRASIDGKRWTEIVVAASPAEQTVEIVSQQES